MDIQSNNIAASLFDGLAQSQQTQGAAAKNDLFSKMMDRMLADAAARKREQAADAARDSANQAKDARAADAQRNAPVRAEPKPDPNRDTRAQTARRSDADAEPARTQDPKAAGTDGDREVQAGRNDRNPVKGDKPKDSAKTDGAKTDGAKANICKSDAAKAGTEAAGADQAEAGEGTETAVADAAAAETDSDAAMAEGGGSGDASAEDAGTGEQTADQPLSAAMEPAQQQPVRQPSDLILAGLTAPGQSATGAAGDDGQGGGDAAAAGAADATARLAQAQAAAGTPNAAQTGADAAAKNATDATPVNGDGARQAQAAAVTGVDGGAQSGDEAAEALPDDDAALPDRFADLLAAAKAKSGEAKQGGKQAGADGGSRNDAQPQAMPQAATAAPAVPPVAETVATSATARATGALEGLEGASAAAGHGHGAAGVHTHPALAAMEGMHGGISGSIPGIDQPQAAATLRPSRGSAGMPMGVHDQIAVHIKKQVGDEVDQFTINLHPAELGRIDIKLDIGADGRVSAMVAVERAQTLELLQRDSRGLERALQEAGLQTDSNSLNFSLRGEGNPFGNDGRGNGKGNGGGRRGLDGGADQDASDTAVYTATLGNGRLDIRA
ncbi:flagellar hook-length control protein FliK [Azospirillum humicireducens]|uniref:Flagellar hook-length control protein FliK n=1 Tax=Azospirillum humicireducens TaxID=1226968 RepID=A0A160JFR0_9PROT|nr:flagellar hook-length control protein FliK [Azospirillum humicireducens]ANC91748.1 flagellar hook-length control protein FliK [Azospirillum humicireducens]